MGEGEAELEDAALEGAGEAAGEVRGCLAGFDCASIGSSSSSSTRIRFLFPVDPLRLPSGICLGYNLASMNLGGTVPPPGCKLRLMELIRQARDRFMRCIMRMRATCGLESRRCMPISSSSSSSISSTSFSASSSLSCLRL